MELDAPVSPSQTLHLALVLDALAAQAALLDARGVISQVNQAWRQQGAGALPGPGADAAALCNSMGPGGVLGSGVVAGMRRVLAGQSPNFRYEFERQMRGGQRWLEMTVSPLGRGGPQGALVLVTDITERKQAQETQWRDRQLLNNIVENIPTAVHVKSVADGCRVMLWNKAAEGMYGLPRAEAIGRNVHDLWPAESAHRMHAADMALLEQGGEQTFADRPAQTRDRGEIRVHMRKVALRDSSGKVSHLLVVADDITEQLARQEELREREQRFRSLTEMASDWYWQQDAQMRFTFFSGGDADDLAGPPGERQGALGKARWELPDLQPARGTWQAHKDDMAARRPFRNFEYVRNRPGMEPVYLSVNGEPVFDAQGAFTGYRGTARNITPAKLAEQEILRLKAQLGT
ncbi:MAG: PAS domain S-box protein [Burkholderiales bacterium]|nr:PAS domain S-box protein [Burkholderiales bacterium]